VPARATTDSFLEPFEYFCLPEEADENGNFGPQDLGNDWHRDIIHGPGYVTFEPIDILGHAT